jgi:hypothetical protein
MLLRALALALLFVTAANSAPDKIKVSLRGVGKPQFPTGYWLSHADPHFNHSQDRIFWLDNGRVALTFFDQQCCAANNKTAEAKFRSAIFDTAGKKVDVHDWEDIERDPFYIGGHESTFWVRHRDSIELLRPDYSEAGRLEIVRGSYVVWSKSTRFGAYVEGTSVSIFDPSQPATKLRVTIPSNASVADLDERTLLLEVKSGKQCGIRVLGIKDAQTWTFLQPLESIMDEPRCPSALAVLPSNAVLAQQRGSKQSQIIRLRRGEKAVPVMHGDQVINVAGGRRVAVQVFHANPIADFLDMDFGGSKELSIFDLEDGKVVFRKTIGGQSGAALSPDGHHLAVVESGSLYIYDLLH